MNPDMTFPISGIGLKLPQRVSLVTQTINLLKESIQADLWTGQLPGEHELCESLCVSRVTLRKALDELQREGWLRSRQGRRREIALRGRYPATVSRQVVLLTPVALQNLTPFTIYWMDSLREHLNKAGYHLEIRVGQAAFGAQLERSLAQLQVQLRPAGWVIYRSNEQMQQWFSERNLPCVITGSRHANIGLPSVDVDYRAICRHAVGQFLGRKHQQLVFLNPESGLAGDLESEQGFMAAAKNTSVAGVQASVIRHDGTAEGVCKKIDLLLERPTRFTALLVSRPAHVITAVSHLLCRGLRLPKDVALISRDADAFLDNLVPTVARYAAGPVVYARKVSRVVLAVVGGSALSSPDIRIMPQFISGHTLG